VTSSFAHLPDDERWIKRLIWLYFWLLIFEGALRKWIVPGLSAPLLIVRDPVVVAIYALALARGRWPQSGFIAAIAALALVSFLASFGGEWSTFKVTLFGMRTDFLHLPLIFLMPRVFHRSDVVAVGKWILCLAIPMAGLVYLQFRAPPDAWVNTGAGGGEMGQITSAFGKIRPPGTFSYNNGLTSLTILAGAFLYFANFQKGLFSKWLLRPALLAVIIMIGLSGSRGSLGTQAVLMAVVLLICFVKPRLFQGSVRLVAAAALLVFVASGWSEYRLGLDVLDSRVVGSGGVKEGMVDRFFGGFLTPFQAAVQAPLLGYGLGIGTNAGSSLLHGGEREFLLAEGDLARVVLESGPILGFAFILLRLAIVLHLGAVSWRSLKQDNPLPMLIFGGCFLDIFMTQFGQPTALGFACFGGGLCLAAAQGAGRWGPPPPDSPSAKLLNSGPMVRGRSPYAETLHNETAIDLVAAARR
jgi:hypothetical protein